MNLFVLGRSSSCPVDVDAARRSLGSLLEQLPFLEKDNIETWRSPSGRVGMAWGAHPPEAVGGVRYVHVNVDRMACFSGRPIRWTSEHEADGRSPLDPSFYLAPPDRWASALDGRCVAAAYDGASEKLVVCTDPQGAYPLYTTASGETEWISNNAELLRSLRGESDLDEFVLASFFGGGWSLCGDPVWTGVRRLASGTLVTFCGNGSAEGKEVMPIEAIRFLPGSGFDPREAGRIVVAALRALADWPGRPGILQLSGGQDSRTLLAACIAGGIELEAITSGSPGSPDVRVAQELARAAGIRHERLDYDPDGGLFKQTAETARMLALMTSGTVCLADTGGFLLRRREGPLPLWHNGQGGEIARGYYGSGEGLDRDGLVAKLYGAFVGSPPQRRRRLERLTRRLAARDASAMLSAEGARLVENHLRSWVDEQLAAGISPRDVPDMFYLQKRMTTWAGPGHGWVEFGKGDTTAALWSFRLLAQQLGGSAEERRREVFHPRVLDVLAPGLASIPFADGVTRDEKEEGPDPLLQIADDIRDAVLSQRTHTAWHVLSQRAVDRLLAVDPLTLSPDAREYTWKPALWRLATVFMGLSSIAPPHR